MKYRVTMPVACFVTVEVEADDKEMAEDIACTELYVSSFCGNGGNNKLIGVCGHHESIEAGELIEEDGYDIDVEEVEE